MNQRTIQASQTAIHKVQGHLQLRFSQDEQTRQTRLTVNDQRPPLQVVRAFPLVSGAALVHLHNLSGGILGGDQLDMEVDIEPNAAVQLTTTSATRIYRRRSESLGAFQHTQITIQENGLLEYLPDPIIPFSGSHFQQQTTIHLAHNAGLFWWEILAPGRTAHGETFAYEEFTNRFDIFALSRPIACEHFRLIPAEQQLSSPIRLGPYTYSSSFYICRVGLASSDWLKLERSLSNLCRELSQPEEIIWAVSTLVAHGLLVRCLSQSGRKIPAGLLAFWQAAKLAIYQQEAIPPRKVY